MTFFPLSCISHLQFDFLDLSSSLLLLNDDKTSRGNDIFFSSKVFRIKKKKETTLKQATKGLCHPCLTHTKKRFNKKKMDWLFVYFNDQFWWWKKRESVVFFCVDLYTHAYTHISGYLNFKLAFTITSVVIVIKKSVHMAIGNNHLKRHCIPSYIYNYLKSVRGPHFLFNQ